MPKRTVISSILIPAACALALAGCATGGWERMRAEFPDISANCRLIGTELQRDRNDRRLLRLVFRHRSNMAMRAEREGRVACARLWAEERGYRLTVAAYGTEAD